MEIRDSKMASISKAGICDAKRVSHPLSLNVDSDFSELIPIIAEYNFAEIISTFIICLKEFDTKLRSELSKSEEIQVVNSLHFCLQTLITILEKSCSFNHQNHYMLRKLYYSLRFLLGHKRVPLDTINNCGLLLVTLDYNYFELTASFRLLKMNSFATKEYLAVCYGFVISIPSDLLLCHLADGVDKSCIFVMILNSLFPLYNKCPNDCIMLTSILKILSVATQRISFSKENIPVALLSVTMGFLYSHLDHSQNIIKHLSRGCFQNLVVKKDHYCIAEMLNFINCSNELDRRTCVLMSCLSSSIGATRIIANRPKLVDELLRAGKRDISHTYFLGTFISVMTCHFYETDFECWFDTWIKPLFSSPNVCSIYLEESLIEAVKLSPRVVEKLPDFWHLVDETNYLSIVKCILVLHKHAAAALKSDHEKANDAEILWRKCLPLFLVEAILRVPGNEMAVATVSVILESSRRSEDELAFLKIYLDSNICNLDKNQRSLFIAQVDQLVTRMTEKVEKSSKEVDNLFDWLSNRCYENLFPGSSFARRYIALKILDILNSTRVRVLENGTREEKAIIFSCLADSYGENKIIAKRLIRTTSFPNGFLTEEQRPTLCEEIVDMISGPRFCEHDTAVHLLEALEDGGDDSVFSEMFTKRLNLSLSKNGSYFVHISIFLNFLIKRLAAFGEEEFSHTLPIYGFLTMTGRLFHLVKTKNSLEGSWKELIEKVIEISIKCNLVAASVVTQMSPEGYLPQEELEGSDFELRLPMNKM